MVTASKNEFKVRLLSKDKRFDRPPSFGLTIDYCAIGLLEESDAPADSFVLVPGIGWYAFGNFDEIRKLINSLEENRKRDVECSKLYNVLKNNKKFMKVIDAIQDYINNHINIERSIRYRSHFPSFWINRRYVWLITPDGHPFIATSPSQYLFTTVIPKEFKDKTLGELPIILGTPYKLRTEPVKKHYKKCWDGVTAKLEEYNCKKFDEEIGIVINKATKLYDAEYRKWLIEETDSGRYAKWAEQEKADKIVSCTEVKMKLSLDSQSAIEKLESYIKAIQANDITKEKVEEVSKTLNEIFTSNRKCLRFLKDPEVKKQELLCNKKIIKRGKETKIKKNEK